MLCWDPAPPPALSSPDWVPPGTEGWAWIQGSGPCAVEASRSWPWAEKVALRPTSLRAPVGDGLWEMEHASVISGPEEAPPEPGGAQASMEESQEELTGGLDVAECEKRAREMLGVGRDSDEGCTVCPVVGWPPSAPAMPPLPGTPGVSPPVKCDSSPPPGFAGRPDWV